ncbi:uncharacterized protein VP01_2657g5 [Puccinia sorghi]|uniref:Uncharacterized protein n=1 Tax=Puccinia sorghi TaxID=27349 RepID=A0A0L6V4S8_9BASI|nr:uncharacterized protein VP01_2657g5 [Puccinia sorghi]
MGQRHSEECQWTGSRWYGKRRRRTNDDIAYRLELCSNFQQIARVVSELDVTLLKHAGRASNLESLLDFSQLPPLLAKIAPALNQKKKFKILNCENEMRGICCQSAVPVPTISKSITCFKHFGLTYTDSIDSGSSIEYFLSTDKTDTYFGKIQKIFQIFLCVDMPNLSPQDRLKNPYQLFCPNLNVHVFYATPLLPKNNIFFQHESDKFNTKHNLIAVKSLSHSCAGSFL